ncbi:MAG: CoA transferase, partial [Hyphomicrobiales bacterium]
PAPRLSRTPGELDLAPPAAGQHTREVLSSLKVDESAIDLLIAEGAVGTDER